MIATTTAHSRFGGIARLAGNLLRILVILASLLKALFNWRVLWAAGFVGFLLLFAEPLWVAFTFRPEVALAPLPKVRLLDTNGKFYAALGPPYQPITPTDLTKNLIRATVAAEDGRFFQHPGVDAWGIGRAAVVDGFRSIRAGRLVIAQGASTITMQLVQLSLGRTERSSIQKLQCKVIELIAAFRLESALGARLGPKQAKRAILIAYLNKVPFGHNITGVGAASQCYFGVSASHLSLGQAAMLMGTIRAPSRFSPFRSPESAVRERDRVITQMKKFGLINAKELARIDTRAFVNSTLSVRYSGNGYIRQAVEREIHNLQRDGKLARGDWNGRDISIDLSLDQNIQRAAELAACSGLERLRKRGGFLSRELDCAVVAIDQKSGAILAAVGGTDFRRHQYDCALQAKRPTGSTFKSLSYLTFFENGGSTDQFFLSPKENLTVRSAFAHSNNAIAIEVARKGGRKNVQKLARQLELPVSTEDSELVLGSYPVSVVKMASIYAAIADGGTVRSPFLIRQIRVDGTSVYRCKEQAARLASPGACEKLMECQREVFRSGTGSAFRDKALRLHLAGKTGTTDDCRDAWFIGSNPAITVAVWTGHRNNKPMPAWVCGATAALPIWMDVMRAVGTL